MSEIEKKIVKRIEDKYLEIYADAESEEDAKIEFEMMLLAEKLKINSEIVENNLVVIQKTDTPIAEFEDKYQKAFLKWLYSNMRFKKDFAFASLICGILTQNRLFFATSKESLCEAVYNDPDNTDKSKSIEWKPFCALLARNGICQLWDAEKAAKKEDRKVSGFVVLNPEIRSLLKVDKELALIQFKELKKLSRNDWVTEDMIFDSCGELRVSIDEHRLLIEERRTKSSERGVKALGHRGLSADDRAIECRSIDVTKVEDKKLIGFGRHRSQPNELPSNQEPINDLTKLSDDLTSSGLLSKNALNDICFFLDNLIDCHSESFKKDKDMDLSKFQQIAKSKLGREMVNAIPLDIDLQEPKIGNFISHYISSKVFKDSDEMDLIITLYYMRA